jgi:hypothetical protein
MNRILIVVSLILMSSNLYASELTWGFKNPAFHYGNGYSTHVLSVEQLQHNRKEDLRKSAEAEAARIERELENTTLAKFLRNIESRIYATLSKQMVDAMFADCGDICSNTGTATIEGSTITWIKDPIAGTITLSVTEEDGSITEITIPTGEFGF